MGAAGFGPPKRPVEAAGGFVGLPNGDGFVVDAAGLVSWPNGDGDADGGLPKSPVAGVDAGAAGDGFG